MTLPVVYGACAANPGTHFVMLTRKLPARLFVSPPENLSVVGIDTALYKGPVGMARLLNEMRGNFGVTTMVDLHDVLRTKIMRLFARLRGMKVAKVDKGRREKKSLTRHSDKAVIQLMPMPQRYKEAFSRAGIDISKPASRYSLQGKGDPALFAKVSAPKQEGEFWLAVAPFAAHAGKIYPLPLLAKVIDHYAEQPHCRVFIFGAGDKERNRIAELAKDRANVVSMAENPIGIEGELALMSHCDTMLAMDSANMHMASLVGAAHCEHMGSHTSLCRILRHRAKPCRRRAARHGVPPMLRVRQQALRKGRLPLPLRNISAARNLKNRLSRLTPPNKEPKLQYVKHRAPPVGLS